MSSNFLLVLDVGGTEIKGAVVNCKGKLIESTISKYPSKSGESKEVILTNFVNIIRNLIKISKHKNAKYFGVVLAFPGPFDYEKGISYIKGVNKYESIYGVNIYNYLKSKIKEDRYLSEVFLENFRVCFENDARVFALGEYNSLKETKYKRVVVVTLGTGVGSAFINNGKIVKKVSGIPEGGYIYNIKIDNTTIEESLSARGIESIAKSLYDKLGKDKNLEFSGVKSLAERARKNDEIALKVFEIYEKRLIKSLLPILENFNSDALILGGQISKSADLFTKKLGRVLKEKSIDLIISKNNFISTFIGGYFLFKNRFLGGVI